MGSRKINEYFRKLVYVWVYDPLYSVYYSAKEILSEFLDLLNQFKKPKMWSSILYIACFYAFLTHNATLFRWLIPAILIVYLIRQRVDGAYRNELKKRAFIKGDDVILKEEYSKYQRESHFMKKEPLEYELWKEQERNKLVKT